MGQETSAQVRTPLFSSLLSLSLSLSLFLSLSLKSLVSSLVAVYVKSEVAARDERSYCLSLMELVFSAFGTILVTSSLPSRSRHIWWQLLSGVRWQQEMRGAPCHIIWNWFIPDIPPEVSLSRSLTFLILP